MENQGGQSTPPMQQPPEQPPQQDWQSQPTQPSAPPPGSGMSAAQPGPVAGSTVADFVTRVIAYIIDGLIIGVANFVVSMLLFPLLFGALGGLYVVIQAVLILAISAGYFIYFWTTRKQTPGMMVMKLMVVEEGTGNALAQDKAVRRWLYLGLPLALSTMLSVGGGFGVGVIGLGGLAILFTLATLVAIISIGWQIYLAYTTYQDPRKQGAHDKAVNSVVISVGPSPLGGNRG